MGNKQSHDESDSENHVETFREKIKNRTPSRPAVLKLSSSESKRRSSCSSSASDKESNESGARYTISTPSKPDGIVKLAKVSVKFIYWLILFSNLLSVKELMIQSQNQDSCDGISLNTFSVIRTFDLFI